MKLSIINHSIRTIDIDIFNMTQQVQVTIVVNDNYIYSDNSLSSDQKSFTQMLRDRAIQQGWPAAVGAGRWESRLADRSDGAGLLVSHDASAAGGL